MELSSLVKFYPGFHQTCQTDRLNTQKKNQHIRNVKRTNTCEIIVEKQLKDIHYLVKVNVLEVYQNYSDMI